MFGNARVTAAHCRPHLRPCPHQRQHCRPANMPNRSSSSSRIRRGLQVQDSMRRKESSSRVGSLPEDGHHQPTETPEAWLLVQDHAEDGTPAAALARRSKKLKVPYLGLEITPELVAISMVYFVQGILGLSRLALSFFFKDDLGIEPAQVAVLVGLAGLPWVVKPLYGFISDSIPLFGYRRRSYLMLCGLAGSASWLSLAFLVNSSAGAVAAMLLGSFSTACSDVVVDSLVVERVRGKPAATAGSLQSLCWASSAVGGIASAYFSGSLVQDYGSHTVFALTAVFPLIVSASALLIDEQRVRSSALGAAGGQGSAPLVIPSSSSSAAVQDSQRSSTSSNGKSKGLVLSRGSSIKERLSNVLSDRVVDQAVALWDAVKQRHILLPTMFVFLWQATPTADTAMFYFYTNQLNFTPEFLGRVSLAGAVARLAGVALYNGVFKSVPLKRMLLWAMLLGVALGSTQLVLVSGANKALGLSDELFVLGDSVILTALGQVSFMPILVLAARLCPQGVEATLFATLMSILNAGGFTGSALGAGLTSMLGVTSSDFSNLFLLVLLCNFSTLLPAPFLWLLPKEVEQDPDGPDGSSSSSAGKSAAAAVAAAGVDVDSSSNSSRLQPQSSRRDSVSTMVAGSGEYARQQQQQQQRHRRLSNGSNEAAAAAALAGDEEQGEPLLGNKQSRWQ